MTRATRWESHRRFDLPIDGIDRFLIVGSCEGNFDFYITDRYATQAPKALGLGTERPTVRVLFNGLLEAGLSPHDALLTCFKVGSTEPDLLYEDSGREMDTALEHLRRLVCMRAMLDASLNAWLDLMKGATES